MKYVVSILCLLPVLFIFSCGPKTAEAPDEDLADTTWLYDPPTDKWSSPSETFIGTANDMRMKFQHKNYTSYRLIIALDTTEGALNTERGFQDDEDATLYILDYDRPADIKWHFVRMTDGRILILDKDRNVLPDVRLGKE